MANRSVMTLPRSSRHPSLDLSDRVPSSDHHGRDVSNTDMGGFYRISYQLATPAFCLLSLSSSPRWLDPGPGTQGRPNR